jgi:hypothetical protein
VQPGVWFDWDGEYVKFSQTKTRQKYRGEDKYGNHQPGDERVVVFVRPEHTTKKDG